MKFLSGWQVIPMFASGSHQVSTTININQFAHLEAIAIEFETYRLGSKTTLVDAVLKRLGCKPAE